MYFITKNYLKNNHNHIIKQVCTSITTIIVLSE